MTWRYDSHIDKTQELMNLYGLAWWRFDEASGNVTDSKGNFTGTISSVSRSTGWEGKGNCLNFTTSAPLVTFNNRVIPLGEKTFRFKLMVGQYKTTSRVMCNSTNSTTAGVSINLGNGILSLGIRKSNSGTQFLYSNTSLERNVWYDIHFTIYGSTIGSKIELYINGVKDAETILTINETLSNVNLRLGNFGYNILASDYFNGKLDEFQIYTKALTPEDFVNEKQLIKINDEYLYYDTINLQWVTLGVTPPTYQDFLNYGNNNITQYAFLLDEQYQVVSWTDNKLPQKFKLNGTKIEPFQLTTLQNPIGIKWASNLKRINVTSSINNGIKCTISFDNTSWYGQGLSSLSNLDREIVASDGMILDELISYSSTNLEPIRNKSGHLYLAFYFPDEASIIDSIEIIGDEWGKYKQEQMTSNSYEVSYLNPTTLEVKLFKNYDAIKINY